MKKISQTGVEIVFVILSVLGANAVYLKINLIPKFIFTYQQGFFSNSELLTVLFVYVIVGFFVLFFSKLTNYRSVFSDEKHFMRELFLVFFSSTLSSLIVFLFTKVFFDPNFIAWQSLLVVMLFLCGFAFRKLFYGINSGSKVLLSGFGRLPQEFAKYGFSLSGVCILLFSLLPVFVAIKFKNDKGFANTVNTIRNFSADWKLDYKFISEYEGISFAQPMFVRHHPIDLKKKFILERAGKLFVLDVTKTEMKQLVLDFSERVGAVQVENGALGFAFHPQFGVVNSPSRGFIFVYYTDYTDVREGQQVNRIVRFDLSVGTHEGRLKSETILVELMRDSRGFHNGGSIGFGQDGFLYFAVGDSSVKENLQTISKSLFSGIFRIDVDQRGGNISHPIPRQPRAGRTGNYMVPNDNPFVDVDGSLEEFWALGLRNPFRFSFDGETGKLWVGDVGSAEFEEVDVVEKGGNYQYPYFEGDHRTEAEIPKKLIGQDSPPFFTYRHDAFERAIIGGMIYRGEKYKNLVGKYVFADNGAGQLYYLENMDGKNKKKIVLAKTHHYGYQGISSVYEDSSGEIFITVLGSKESPTGKILRLEKKSDTPTSPFDVFRNIFSSANEQNISKGTYTVQESRETFMNNCARCHGQKGKGSMELAIKLPNFSDPSWQQEKSDEHLIQVISQGGAKLGLNSAMPPWKGVLNDDEIIALVKFIRTLKEGS